MTYKNFTKIHWIILIITLFIATSWTGVLDRHSKNYANQSIKEAAITYASVRGVNAIVTTLKSTEVQVGVGVTASVTVGEVLDPIHDLIERVSEVTSIAIGSLVLQKILLAIVSNDFFKYLLTFFGFFSIWVLWYKKNEYIKTSLKLFLIIVFVRFSLVFVVAINSVVENAFLKEEVAKSNMELKEFEQDLRNNDRIPQEELERLKLENLGFNKKIQLIMQDNGNLDSDIKIQELNKKDSRNNLEVIIEKTRVLELKLSEITTIGDIFIHDTPDQLKIKESVKSNSAQEEIFEKEIDDFERDIEYIKERMNENNSSIENLKEELKGNSDRIDGKLSLIEKVKAYTQLPDFSKISDSIDKYIDNLFRLLILYLLKTIFIPVLFFYALIKMVKTIWDIDWVKVVS